MANSNWNLGAPLKRPQKVATRHLSTLPPGYSPMWVSSMCWIRSPKLGNVMPQPLNLHMLIKNTAIFHNLSRLARSNRDRPTDRPASLSLPLTHCFYAAAASNRSLSRLTAMVLCCADVVAPPTTQSRNSPSRGLLRHWLVWRWPARNQRWMTAVAAVVIHPPLARALSCICVVRL